MLRPGTDTRQGTHMESFLLTRSVLALLMNGCSKSEETESESGEEGAQDFDQGWVQLGSFLVLGRFFQLPTATGSRGGPLTPACWRGTN